MNRRERIEEALRGNLSPDYLEVVDESGGHNVPESAESHFRVTVVTKEFAGKNEVARHRMVYQGLQDEFSQGLHALALHTHTPQEWSELRGTPESPPCMGGSGA